MKKVFRYLFVLFCLIGICSNVYATQTTPTAVVDVVDRFFECLEDNETLKVDFTKSPTDKDVNVLQCAKLQQDKNRLLAERKEIDNEISQIEKHREELLKY